MEISLLKTVEAVIDEEGRVRLLEDVRVASPRRALLTILDPTSPSEEISETALLAERALEDWKRPEEHAAWSHLQPPAK